MADIVLRLRKIGDMCNIKYQGMCVQSPPTGDYLTGGGRVLTYHMRNFSCQSIDLDTPVQVIRLPQEGSECTFTLKVEGNQETMSVGWTLMDETGQVCTLVTEFTGAACRPAVVLTVCDQLDFLFNTIENKNICYDYDLFLGCSGLSTCANLTQSAAATDYSNSSLFRRHVKVLQTTVTKTGRTPITYNATMRFVVGVPALTVSEKTTSA